MTSVEVWEAFQSKKNRVSILLDALSYMQQYNGRSPIECIAMAMDLDLDDE